MSTFISESWADIEDTPTLAVEESAPVVTEKIEEPALPPAPAVVKKTLDLDAPQPKATGVKPSELGKTAIIPEETTDVTPPKDEPQAPAPITIEDLLNEPSEYFRVFVTGIDVGGRKSKRDVEDVIGNFFLSKGTTPVDVKVPLVATAERPDDWKIPEHYNSMAVVCFIHPEDVEKVLKGNDEWRMNALKSMSFADVPRAGNAASLLKERETLATRLGALLGSAPRDGSGAGATGTGRSFAALAPESRPQESDQKSRKGRKNRERRGGRNRSEKKKETTAKSPPARKPAAAPVAAVTEDGFAVAGGAKAARVRHIADKPVHDRVKGSTPVTVFDDLSESM